MKLGIWPAEYALGERYRAIMLMGEGYDENAVRQKLKEYIEYSCITDMKTYQKRGERAAVLLNGSGGNSSNNALFGTPINRSKENTDRIHAITLSMGADTGKRDREANAYNAAVVPLYILQNQDDGTYVLPSGGRTKSQGDARCYTDRAEAESHRLSRQTIVEV